MSGCNTEHDGILFAIRERINYLQTTGVYNDFKILVISSTSYGGGNNISIIFSKDGYTSFWVVGEYYTNLFEEIDCILKRAFDNWTENYEKEITDRLNEEITDRLNEEILENKKIFTNICDMYGVEIVSIKLKNKKTGKVWDFNK